MRADRITHLLIGGMRCIDDIKLEVGDGSRPKPLEVFLLDDNLEDLLSSIGAQLDPALLAKAHAKRLDARDVLLDEIGRNRQLRATLRANHGGFDCVARFVGCVAAMEPWPVPPQQVGEGA